MPTLTALAPNTRECQPEVLYSCHFALPEGWKSAPVRGPPDGSAPGAFQR